MKRRARNGSSMNFKPFLFIIRRRRRLVFITLILRLPTTRNDSCAVASGRWKPVQSSLLVKKGIGEMYSVARALETAAHLIFLFYSFEFQYLR